MRVVKGKTSFIVLVSLVFFNSLSADATNKRKSLRLTEKDKAQIIESILRKEFSKEKFAEVEKFLFVQNKILKPHLIPSFYKEKIVLIALEAVQAKIKTEENILVFSFREFKVMPSKVVVEFDHTKYIKSGSFNSEASTYEYQKVRGRWLGWATKGRMTIAE